MTVTASDGVNVSDAQEVAITVTNVDDTAGVAVIDLGAYGKLIAPVQVEGKWYYYWDRSGDGSSENPGPLNGGADYTTHEVLDGIFNQDFNGVVNTRVANADGLFGTTDTYRYATLNGVHVALPTANGGVAYGKLIAPVQVDGGQWFYFWDRSGDGTSANTGSLNGGNDSATHDVLDAIFNKDINGVVGGAGNTSDTYRYATLNGVHLALPSIGGSTGFPYGPSGISESQPGTAVGAAPAFIGSNATNTSYDGLLAIWDAYNGTTTSIATSGLPSGWNGTDYYWAATSSSGGHASLFLEGSSGGYVRPDLDPNSRYVALQVL